MNSKHRKILYITISIIVIFAYILKFIEISKSAKPGQFSFTIPKVPQIKIDIPKESNIGNEQVWNINSENSIGIINTSKGRNAKGKSNKIQSKACYTYKLINGIPTLINTLNRNYKWQFYGTAFRNDNYSAFFYNPLIKTAKIVKEGETIDQNLKIVKIQSDDVKVNCNNKSFTLKIFNFKKGVKK